MKSLDWSSIYRSLTRFSLNITNNSSKYAKSSLRIILRDNLWLARILKIYCPPLLTMITRYDNDSNSHNNNNNNTSSSSSSSSTNSNNNNSMVIPNICALCDADPPEMPHILTDCKHLFCYLCIVSVVVIAKKEHRDKLNTSISNKQSSSSSSSAKNTNNKDNSNTHFQNMGSSNNMNFFDFKDEFSDLSHTIENDTNIFYFKCPICNLKHNENQCLSYSYYKLQLNNNH